MLIESNGTNHSATMVACGQMFPSRSPSPWSTRSPSTRLAREDGTKYEASATALEELEVAPAFKGLLFGGRPTQLGWCCGHTRLNALEYHRSSEFNLGANDFILLLAKRHQIEGMGVDATLDMSLVRAFRAPAGVLVEVFADTLHYAPCQTGDEGFRTLVALPQGTNGPLPELDSALANAGDAPLLWAADKWLIVHADKQQGCRRRPRGSSGREHRDPG